MPESEPEGRARFCVRGFSESSSASMRRFIDMATVRAVIMQRRMRSSLPGPGQPLAARNVESRAKGRAKRVWESLISLARVISLRRKEDSPPRLEDTKAPLVGAGGVAFGADIYVK